MTEKQPDQIARMDAALDKIHDIAVKAASVDNIPREVEAALDKIISLARYKSDVLGRAGQ